MDIKDRWEKLLRELRSRGAYRSLSYVDGVDLSSNDYLGYASEGELFRGHETTSVALQDRTARAARLLRGNHAVWEDVESILADWHGAESALIMGSGYAANEGLLSTIIESEDWVASDRLNHASIIDGLTLARAERFVYEHRDLDHLEQGLSRAAATRSRRRRLFIVTESLFGMDGDLAPLKEIVELAERFEAHVIVDEAHATGCYGREGSGLVDMYGLRSRVLASVHTGGKALAVHGAYVCGSRVLVDLLINRCKHFMFSTALPPALGYWWRESLGRVRIDGERRKSLHETAFLFRRELERQGLPLLGTEYIVPVVVGEDGDADRVAREIHAKGWDVRAIRTPTVPEGTARLRVSVHADHSIELLMDVAVELVEALARKVAL
jgi:8-amino-7-oxononanoate synthase